MGGVPSLQELASRHILHNADEHMVNIVTTPDEAPPTLVAKLREGVSKRSGCGKHGRRNLKENETSCPHSTPEPTPVKRETIPQIPSQKHELFVYTNVNVNFLCECKFFNYM